MVRWAEDVTNASMVSGALNATDVASVGEVAQNLTYCYSGSCGTLASTSGALGSLSLAGTGTLTVTRAFNATHLYVVVVDVDPFAGTLVFGDPASWARASVDLEHARGLTLHSVTIA